MEIKTTKQIIDERLDEISTEKKYGYSHYCLDSDKRWVAVDNVIKEIDKHFKCTKYHKIGNLNLTCLDVIKGELLGIKPKSKTNR